MQQFLAYLVAAMQTIDTSIGVSAWVLLQARPPPSARSVLTALFNDVAEDLEGILLVLDDYHLVACEPVDEALAYLVDHLPPQVHVALATRTDPALPLARLRAQGQLTELRQEDLRFSIGEAAALLDQTMARKLSDAHVTILVERTEGWFANGHHFFAGQPRPGAIHPVVYGQSSLFAGLPTGRSAAPPATGRAVLLVAYLNPRPDVPRVVRRRDARSRRAPHAGLPRTGQPLRCSA